MRTMLLKNSLPSGGQGWALLSSKSCLDSSSLCLVAWLLEKSEHILLVSLYAWLVECVDTEELTRDATSNLEEVDELTVVVSIETLDRDEDVRNTTVDVCETCAELSILVNLVDALASKEVKTVEVLLVVWEEKLALWILDRDTCLEDSALAFLNPLTH